MLLILIYLCPGDNKAKAFGSNPVRFWRHPEKSDLQLKLSMLCLYSCSPECFCQLLLLEIFSTFQKFLYFIGTLFLIIWPSCIPLLLKHIYWHPVRQHIDIYTWIVWLNIWLGLGSSYLEEISIPSEPHFTLQFLSTSLLTVPYLRSTNLTEFALGGKEGVIIPMSWMLCL